MGNQRVEKRGNGAADGADIPATPGRIKAAADAIRKMWKDIPK